MRNNHTKLSLSFIVEEMASEKTGTTTPIEKQIAKKNVGTTNVLNPNASLVFNGDTLTWMVNGTPIKQWKGISGLTLLNSKPNQWGNTIKRITARPETWSKDKGMGPTPPGNYVLGTLESRKGNRSDIGKFKSLWLSIKDGISGKWNDNTQSFNADTLYSQISWGNFRAPIIVAKGTNTFGRGSFYLHGGTLPGSHGCIDLAGEMDDFAKFYGTWLASTRKNSISLNVDYGAKNEVVNDAWKASSGEKPVTTQPTTAPAQPTTAPAIKPVGTKVFAQLGTRGSVVSDLQTKLKLLSYNIGVKGVDGKFGYDTQKALMKFQSDNGLKANGVFDTATSNKLNTFQSPVQPPMKNEFM